LRGFFVFWGFFFVVERICGYGVLFSMGYLLFGVKSLKKRGPLRWGDLLPRNILYSGVIPVGFCFIVCFGGGWCRFLFFLWNFLFSCFEGFRAGSFLKKCCGFRDLCVCVES